MEKILIISLIVWAIYISLQEGMIFGKLGEEVNNRLGDYWSKPVSSCPVCMAPWYGSVIYWLVWGISVGDWLICTIAAMGLNAVLVKLMPDKE